MEQRREDKSGCWYPGVDKSFLILGQMIVIFDPNFPTGTAGIGFVLMKLYEAGNDPEISEESTEELQNSWILLQR